MAKKYFCQDIVHNKKQTQYHLLTDDPLQCADEQGPTKRRMGAH